MKHFIFYLVFTILLGHIGMAQWDIDPQGGKVIGKTSNKDYNCKMVSDGAGGAIFFWIDEISSISNAAKYLRYNKIDAAGNLGWSNTAAGNLVVPGNHIVLEIAQVISDGAGGAFISFYCDYGFYIQHIGQLGQTLFPGMGILVTSNIANSRMTIDGTGGVVVAWTGWQGWFELTSTFAQRFDASGTKQWTENAEGIKVVDHEGYNTWEEPLGIINDGFGNFIFLLSDGRNCTLIPDQSYDNMDLYAQKLDGDGIYLWNKEGMPVCTAENNQFGEYSGLFDKIQPDGAGGAFIVWKDHRFSTLTYPSEQSPGQVYAQRLNDKGEPQWTMDGIAISQELTCQGNLQSFHLPGGGLAITWSDIYLTTIKSVFVQKLDAEGKVQFSPTGIKVIANQETYQSTLSDDGSAIVFGYGFNTDIYAQKIMLADGSQPWGEGKVVNSHSTNAQVFESIVSTPDQGAILGWCDGRNYAATNYDVYASKLASDGTLPLRLITFIADMKNKVASLQWQVADKEELSHFDVERSLDGLTFQKIGTVRPFGDDNQSTYYEYQDPLERLIEKGTPWVYYRLFLAEKDGSGFYSAMRKLGLPTASFEIKLMPNPAQDAVWVEMVSPVSQVVTILWTDNSGRIIDTRQEWLVQGKNTLRINVSSFAQGIYRLTIQTRDGIKQGVMIRQ